VKIINDENAEWIEEKSGKMDFGFVAGIILIIDYYLCLM